MLKVESITKKYGRKTVLKDISFEIKEGEFVFLVGRNGVGKSTLLKIVAGLEEQSEGKVLLSGNSEITLVSEDLIYHPYFKIRNIIESTAPFYKTWNSSKLEQHLGNCTFKIDDNYRTLSRGQKTQLQLCIALSSGSKIVLIDEATVTLDPKANTYFMDALKKYTFENGTVLFATNNLADIKSCDRLIFLDEGQLLREIDKGNVNKVFSSLGDDFA